MANRIKPEMNVINCANLTKCIQKKEDNASCIYFLTPAKHHHPDLIHFNICQFCMSFSNPNFFYENLQIVERLMK